ncbi:MAG: DUF1566 domain-containing protein [Pseudomonadota bacterium]
MKPESRRRARALSTLLAAALTAFTAPAGAACNGADITASTPDARFVVSGETVSDSATGLIWKRCAEGLTGADCAGGAALSGSWAEALARVAAVNAAPATLGANSADWRLPNRNELASLVERKCAAPAINATIFPRTPAQSFWTGSPYAQHTALAWYVDYNAGDVGPALKTGAKNIRLVRAGQQQ